MPKKIKSESAIALQEVKNGHGPHIADVANNVVLDKRDQKALREIEEQIAPMRLALAETAMQLVQLQRRQAAICNAIAQKQAESQKVIAEGAKAQGTDIAKGRWAFNYETMTLTGG